MSWLTQVVKYLPNELVSYKKQELEEQGTAWPVYITGIGRATIWLPQTNLGT